MNLKHTVKWYVSLNNGETFFEGKNKFVDIDGEKSPWLRLVDHLIDNNLQITSLGLYSDDGRRWNLASAGACPKFKMFENVEKPIDYNVERSVAREMQQNGEIKIVEFYTVARALYEHYELQLWVNNFNPDISYSYIKKL